MPQAGPGASGPLPREEPGLCPAVFVWSLEERLDPHVSNPPDAVVAMKVVVVTGRDPERSAVENRGLEVGPISDCLGTVDADRLIGEQVQSRRSRTGKPLNDRALPFMAAEHVGQASSPLPDCVGGEVLSDRMPGDIARVSVSSHQPTDLVLALKDVKAFSQIVGVGHGSGTRRSDEEGHLRKEPESIRIVRCSGNGLATLPDAAC